MTGRRVTRRIVGVVWSERLHLCPACRLYYVPNKSNQIYCDTLCRVSTHKRLKNGTKP